MRHIIDTAIFSSSVFFIALAVCVAGTGTFAAQAERNAGLTQYGTVSSVDWVGGTVMINGVKYIVPAGLEIPKGGDTVGFADINIGDSVRIEYVRVDGDTRLIRAMTVQYSGAFPE